MSFEPIPACASTLDPALDVAERQLVMLGELARIAMAVSRAFGESAIASAEAEKRILADEYFVPEVGRARACGARDAAESFQKASRALRLTLMLEAATARAVLDLRAGVAPRPSAPERAADGVKPARIVVDEVQAAVVPRRDAEDEGVTARMERPGAECERLFDVERAERLPHGAYVDLVDGLAAAVGAVVDWDAATVSAPESVRLGFGAPRADRSDPAGAEAPGSPPPDGGAASGRTFAFAASP